MQISIRLTHLGEIALCRVPENLLFSMVKLGHELLRQALLGKHFLLVGIPGLLVQCERPRVKNVTLIIIIHRMITLMVKDFLSNEEAVCFARLVYFMEEKSYGR